VVVGVSGCLGEMAVELLRWGSAVLSASGRLGGVVVELLCGLVRGPAVPSGASSLCEQLRRGLSVAGWESALRRVGGWVVIGPPPLLVVRRGSGVGTVLPGLVAG
jgi:hypothetical protein